MIVVPRNDDTRVLTMTVSPSTLTILVQLSMPVVAVWYSSKVLSFNLRNSEVFPTPSSPSSTTLYVGPRVGAAMPKSTHRHSRPWLFKRSYPSQRGRKRAKRHLHCGQELASYILTSSFKKRATTLYFCDMYRYRRLIRDDRPRPQNFFRNRAGTLGHSVCCQFHFRKSPADPK